MANNSISLNRVLAELDISTNPDGTTKTFSIRFIKKDGESVYFLRTRKTGLNMNLKKHAMRGVVPVDSNLVAIDHIYPVWIWSIVQYNNLKVTI